MSAPIPGGREDDSVLLVLQRVAARLSQAMWVESRKDIVELVAEILSSDSCVLYVLEDGELVLCASKNPHSGAVARVKLEVGQDVTGWAAGHRELVVIPKGAVNDPRFKRFNQLTQERWEAFLSLPLVVRGKLVGVMNVQCRAPFDFREREIRLVSAIGCLAAAEIEMARLEQQNLELSKKIETRTLVERAKGILQVDLCITEQEAYQKLQRQSQQMRRSMKEIAEAVVLSHALRSHAHA